MHRNEIGGDGNVPHPAIGSARRLQVQERALQHKELVEAVQNHNPKVGKICCRRPKTCCPPIERKAGPSLLTDLPEVLIV